MFEGGADTLDLPRTAPATRPAAPEPEPTAQPAANPYQGMDFFDLLDASRRALRAKEYRPTTSSFMPRSSDRATEPWDRTCGASNS